MTNNFDIIFVGGGFYSLMFSRLCKHKKTLIFEKSDDIGGTCKGEKYNNININTYGPHIFHTNKKEIWDIINSIDTLENYNHSVYSKIGDKLYSLPINLLTLNEVFNIGVPHEASKYFKELPQRNNKISFEDLVINSIGEELYNLFIKGYSIKNWNTDLKDLSPELFKRIPVRTIINTNYFNCKYCGIPKRYDWNSFINKIPTNNTTIRLDEFIDINRLGELRSYKKSNKSKIIVTSPIDEFFEYKFGKLDYITTNFITRYINNTEYYQGNSVINYPELRIPFIRSIEYKHFDQHDIENTVVQFEYKIKNGNYIKTNPIITDNNIKLYNKYKEYAESNYNDIIFAGRLGEYKYYDMDNIIEQVINQISLLY